jgi:hypothetical protein
MARTCIFCGQPPSARGEGEHIFPQWLNNVLPNEEDDPQPEWTRQMATLGDDPITQTWRASEVASVTTKLVCNRCNTTWMADLEDEAKPILVPMIQGHNKSLDMGEQLIVATWAVKTAMVIQPTLTDRMNFSPEECGIVRTQRHPPASTSVHLAGIEALIPDLQYRCTHVKLGGNDQRSELGCYTFQIRMLVIQVLRLDPPPTDSGQLVGISLPGELQPGAGSVIRIFPPSYECRWPPRKPLDWKGLNDFSRRNLQLPTDWINPPSPPAPQTPQV